MHGTYWTAEEDEWLRTYYRAYRGAPAQIADAIGRSRNSVIGRASRLGLNQPKLPRGRAPRRDGGLHAAR